MRSKGLAFAVLTPLTACVLTTDLDGFSSGVPARPDSAVSDAPTSPTEGGGSAFDAGPDARPAETAPGGVVIARGTAAYPAGSSQQHHVHFAKTLGAFVVFYLSTDDRNVIRTRLTGDFGSFVDGPAIALPRPHDGDGRNLDVAYANLGGADIFHVALSVHDGSRYCLRGRGRGADGTLTFGAMSELSRSPEQSGELDPDGVSLAVLKSGRVVISTGYFDYQGHWGTPNVFVSTSADDGAAGYAPTFAPGQELEYVNRAVNARSVIATQTGASFVYESGEEEPRAKQLRFSHFDEVSWWEPDSTGFPEIAYDVADWNQLMTGNGWIHTMRYAGGSYVHRFFDGSGKLGPAVPASPHAIGDGLVLQAEGNVAHAYVMTTADKLVRTSKLDGTSWTAWTDVAVADPTRSHLSGHDGVLMWQRGNDLVGLKLTR